MPTKVKARKELTIFFVVKADSPSNNQVKIGKLIQDKPKLNNLEDQAVPKPSQDHLEPHQKASDAGPAQIKQVKIGLSDHHFQTN